LKKLKEATPLVYTLKVQLMDKRSHPYIPNSETIAEKEMLRELGINNIGQLYEDVPEKYRLKKSLNLPQRATAEFDVRKHIESLLSKNSSYNEMPIFLGAGCWPHYIPAAVREIMSRSELLTSYTPYQPETSQGILQSLFEYQSMMCELTAMDVSNCSMYDWASALGEAARMAARVTRRNEIVIPRIIHPERAATLHVYTESAGITVRQVEYCGDSGHIDLDDLKSKISDKTAAVYVENPSYLGYVESQMDEIGREAHANDSLFVVGVDPTLLGIIKPPGEYGADIVVGEAQPLGNGMNFGGPLLGIMACRDDMTLIRQMPGRIIGLTTTQDNSRQGFCMALQTREQHIKREKATSNICTNEALCAVASAVYMALLGPEGFRRLGQTIMYKANYAIRLLSGLTGVKVPVFKSLHFKEFTVDFNETGLTVEEVNRSLLRRRVHGGKDVSSEFPELGQVALYSVTEIHSARDIERLKDCLGQILSKR
jgi:glycine dehydrogenase subunit 1